MAEDQSVSRRGFLAIATVAIGGLISFALAIPAIAYIIGPALQKSKSQEWIRIGSTSKVEIGTPTLFKVTIERKSGWIESEEELAVFVLTENGRDYIALSNICTHLGCRVRWINDRQEFFCPCHNGVFDQLGAVVSGPPPRPLDRYEVKVVDDQLYIKGG
jgi:Rieske Fe-S protein